MVTVGDRKLIVSVERDVTARKKAEAALKHSHDLMRYVIAHARSAIAVHDRDLNYVYVSERYLREYNVKEQEVIGKHHYEIFPDLPQKWRDVHQRALKGEVISAEEDSYPHPDGSLDWTRWECRPWHEPNGDIGGIILYTEVITERKRAEERIRESESELRRSQAIAHVGHWIWDCAPNRLRCSEEMKRIFGVDVNAPPVTPEAWLRPAAHPEDAERVLRTAAVLRDGGRVEPLEFRIVRPDGVVRHVLAVQGDRHEDEDGRLTRVTGVVQDITELRQSEEQRQALEGQLQQAMKMEAVGRLAGGIAHDFNNLLTGILGNVELALLDLAPDAPLAATLRTIGQAADSAAVLTRQLLAFSRKQIIEPRVVNLNDLIDNLHKMLVRVIGEDVTLRTVLSKDLHPVLVDPGQFQQVLLNLAVNARDAMPDGGTLVIETAEVELDEAYCAAHPEAQPGPFVMLAVSDTGHGMSDEVKSHLFEPFFTTKSMGRGTGLGLATTFGIVKQAGGSIEVYSEPGVGTSFKVYLPRAEGAATSVGTARGRKGAMPGGRETVLVVEDEAVVRDLVMGILNRLGYRVLAAANAEEALALARRHREPIDLLMTDVVMPGMNGRELAERLTVVHPETRVLYASGYTENVIVHHGVVDATLNFIGKPYSPQGLAMKIRDVLDASSTPTPTP
jgi:PAS domain S-box-containing protein